MTFKVGDTVRRKSGYAGEGAIGFIVSLERGSELTANVNVEGRIRGWFVSRIELVHAGDDFEMDA